MHLTRNYNMTLTYSLWTILAVAGLCAASQPLAAAQLAITSPADGGTVSGVVSFSAQAAGLPNPATVEFRLNGRLVDPGRISAPPYRVEWNSATVWNGEMELQAVARDASGRVVVVSAPVRFRVANGPALARHLTPAPPGPVSGLVEWTVEVRDAGEIEGVMFFVDGQQVGIVWGHRQRYTLWLDTTLFANGAHELATGVHALADPKPPVAMTQTQVAFENGRALRALLPRYREVFLAPGDSVALSPTFLYTNGDRTPATGVAYRSENTGIATVSPTGVVRAVGKGVTNVILEANGKRAQVAVVVGAPAAIPHFSRDGRILLDYQPGESLFVRTLFHLDPNEMVQTPGLAARLRAAGVNALTSGFWALPQDLGNPSTYDEWLSRWDGYWDRIESIARSEDFALLLIGDNVARGPRELYDVLTKPWGLPGIVHAFNRLRDSRRVIGVEMVDEVSGLWGDTPTPGDGRWLNRQPPIPDDAFVRLMNTIRSVPGRSPVTWPVLWLSPPQAVKNWMGNPFFSDYTSMYWDKLAWRRAYPWGISLPQLRESLEHVTLKRRHLIQLDRPLLLQMSAVGPFYTKLGGGSEFTPGQDRLQEPGHGPVSISAQALYAMAVGAAGVRVYSYDSEAWKANRAAPGTGRRDLQTGLEPFRIGTDRWQAMEASFQLIQRLEPYLFQPRLPSPELGPEFVTGARRGPRSALLIVVNMTEAPAVARPDLTPYHVAGATSMVRYRLRGAHLVSETLPLAASDSLTLSPGEGAVWLFLPADDPAASTPSVSFATELPDVVTGVIPITAAVTGPSAPSRVELVVDGQVVDVRTSAPYQFNWNTGAVSPEVWHGVMLRAVGQYGSSVAHAAVMPVPGTAVQNAPPVVGLTSPGNGAVFSAPGQVLLEANAFDGDGKVVAVEFLVNGQVLANVAAPPFQFTWSNVPAGSYTLRARATDDLGAATLSAPVSITVEKPNQPPAVSITAPAAGDVFTAPATVAVSASASDPDGTVARVEFFLGTTLIGADASPPYTATASGVAAGTYTLTARAIDDGGAVRTSAPVTITVSAPTSAPVETAGAFLLGVNLGGPALKIDGNTWLSHNEAVAAGLVLNTSWTFAVNYPFPLVPATDGTTRQMLSSGVWKPGTSFGQGISLAQPIPNGRYDVYLYLVENHLDNYRMMDVWIEGQPSATGIGQLPLGEWRKYGPYTVEVKDGALNIDVLNGGRGDPMLVGFAVYQPGTGATTPSSPATDPTNPNAPLGDGTAGATFYQAVNLGGPAVVAAGVPWLSHEQAVLTGLVSNTPNLFAVKYGFPLLPATDASTVKMLSSGIWKAGTTLGNGLALAYPVPNGSYEVYLYLIENHQDYYRVMQPRLEGSLIPEKIGSLKLGEWKAYGPYQVNVVDGVLNIDLLNAGKGDPMLTGFVLYRVP